MIAGNRNRPLGYAQVTIGDGKVQGLPGLDRDGLINGYAPALTRIRVEEFAGQTVGDLVGISYRDDGDEPTTEMGMPLLAGEREDYPGDPFNLKLVRLGATPVVVHVLYYAAAPSDDEV
jgi:hypothetical protein